MRYLNIGNNNLKGSEIALGCMRITDMNKRDLSELIETSIDNGINFFDHADIYGNGKCEEVFGQYLKESKHIQREDIIIQTKCGIRNGYYDFSKEHIIDSVEESLKRLSTDYVDTLLLHRPDTLMEPEEVAEAFTKLKNQGKVKNFGVSNHNSMQIELLNKFLDSKLIINQLQFGVMHTGIIDNGLNVNMKNHESLNRDGSILEYCRLKDITIQAWSPYQFGFFEGVFLNNDKFPEVNNKINEIAKKYGVSNTTIATAWILRHPAKIQTIAGTTNIKRIKEICDASKIELTRQEWYEIYTAAGNTLP